MSIVPLRGAMVGREHQLSRAVSFISSLEMENCNGILFFWAPPGIGKTRLVAEVEKSVPQREFVLIEGDSDAGSAPFSDFLESWFNLDPGAPPESNLEAFSSIWEGLLLNLEMKELMDIRTELEEAKPYFEYLLGLNSDKDSIAFRLEPAQRAEKTRLALVTFFDVLSVLDPVVMVLENVQWFSREDRLTVKRIIESAFGSHMALIVTGRPDKNGISPDFPDIASYVKTDTIFLDGLPERSIKSFVEELGAGSPNEDLVEFLWDRAGGVPLFLEQTVDYLSETGSIERNGRELLLKTPAASIPVSIRDMFISRMLFMPDSVREAAMAASVLGSSFRISDIAAMLETESVDSDLVTGAAKRIFTLDEYSGSFSHILFRDWISELSPAEELRELHLRAGRILEKESELYPSPSRMEKISDHYLFGGENEKAAFFMGRAAAAYADNFENRSASRLYRKLIPMLDEPEKTRAELQLSDVYKNEGLLNEGTALLSGTLDRIRNLQSIDTHLEALVMLRLGIQLGSSGKLKESEEILRNCLKVFEDCDDIENQTVAVMNLGLIVRSAGRTAEALNLVERSLELARKSKDTRLICASLYWSAITYRQTGDFKKMKKYTEEQVKLAEKSGIIRNIIAGYDNLMRIHIYNRDYDAAVEVHDKLRNAAEKTANWAALSTATSKLGIVHLRRSEWNAAMECFRKCVSLSEKTGNLRAKCAALGNLAHASIAMKDLRSALKYSTELIDTASAIGFRTGLMSGYARMGYIFSLRGDYESALDCLQTQIEHAESLQDIRNLSDGWATIADIQFKLNEIPDSITSIERAMKYSLKADDMLLYSSQLAYRGRILFMSGSKQEAEEFLKKALTLIEEREGREKHVFQCRLYLLAIQAETDPGLSYEILEMVNEAPDTYLKGEAYYCHWKLTGNSQSAAKAVDLLTVPTGSLPQPILQRLLDDLKK
jgi:tetratricopeptide (TPR) repeat protein